MLKKLKPYLFVLTGTTAGALLQFFVVPILAKLCGPHAFAVYAVVFNWALLAHILGFMRYDSAILQSETKHEVAVLNYVCVLGSIGVFVLIFFLLYGGYLSAVDGHTGTLLAVLIALSLSGYMLVELLCKNLIWFDRYKETGMIRSAITVFTSLVQLALAFFVANEVSLILGRVVGVVLASVLGLYFLSKMCAPRSLVSRSGLAVVLPKHKNYPLIDTPSSLANYVSNTLPLLFIPFFYGIVPELGVYALVYRVMQTPANIIRQSLKNVFHKQARNRINAGQFPFFYLLKILVALTAMLVPFCLVTIFFAKPIFAMFFSEAWTGAAEISAYSAVFFSLLILRSPLQTSLQVIDKHKVYLIMEIADLLLKVALVAIGMLIKMAVMDWILAFLSLSIVANLVFVMVSTLYIYRNRQIVAV